MANPWDELEDAEEIITEKQPWDELEDIPQEPKEDISKLEALRLGATEGATLGLDKPIVGASAVAGQLLEESRLSPQVEQLELLQKKLEEAKARRAMRGEEIPQIAEVTPEDYKAPDLLDTYYKAGSEYEKEKEEAASEHPGMFLAGNIVGGIPTGIATGKAVAGGIGKLAELAKTSPKLSAALSSKLAKTAAEGGAFGGILGATKGESEILRGDVENLPEEVLDTAAGGAVLGGGLYGAGKILGKGIGALGEKLGTTKLGEYVKDAFKAGKKGEDILSEEALLKARESAKGISEDIQSTLRKERQTTIPDLDVRGINIKPELDSLSQEVEQFYAKVPELAKDKEIVLAKLKELDDLGVENLTSEEATQVANSIKNLTSTFGDKASPVSNISMKFRKLLSGAGEKINKKLREESGTTEAYERYKKLSEAMEAGGLSTKGKGTYSPVKMEKEVEALKDNMLNASNPTQASKAYDKFKNFTDRLKEVMPEFYKKIEPTIKEVQDKHELIRTAQVAPVIGAGIAPQQHIMAALVGYGKASPIIAAHMVGKGVKAGQDVLAKGMKTFVGMVPEQIQDLAKGLTQNKVSQQFVDQLNLALSSEGAKRSALLYSLYQQPAFRKVLEEAGNVVNPLTEEK